MSTTGFCRRINLCCFTSFTRLRNARIISFSLFVLSFTLLARPAQAAPKAPTNLQANAVSTNQINLSWTDNSNNETGFKIERAPDSSGSPGTWTQITNVAANVITYTNSGLSANTTYWYRVRATNTGGDSAYTAQTNATTLPLPPAAPSVLTATAVSSNQINLSWMDNSNNETGFKIERAPDSSGSPGTWTQITNVAANVITYTNLGLSANTTYWYRVRATNTGGDSAYTAPTSATTLPLPPAAPSGLTATAVSSSQIRLAWTDNSNNETGFKIERAPDNSGSPGTWTQITNVAANVITYTNLGVSANTTYWYRVRATNTGGDSAYTAQTNATTPALVGWWKLDEGTGTVAADASGNGNTGTLSGGAMWTAGILSNALAFDGASGTVEVPTSTTLDCTNALTISAWVYATNSDNRVVISYRLREYDSGWRLYYGNGAPYLQWASSPDGAFHGLPQYAHGPYLSNQWVHLAVVYSSTNISLYVDGTLFDSDAQSGTNLSLTAGYNLGIGSDFNGNHYYFPGVIDDVRLYNKAFSSNEVAALYNTDTVGDGIADWFRQRYFGSGTTTNGSSCATCDPDGDGYTNLQEYKFNGDPTNSVSYPMAFARNLVGWWKLDEGTGTVVADASGNGNTGTLSGGATWTAGILSNAVAFDGASGTVEVPTSTTLDNCTNALTISAWVYATNSANRVVISYRLREYDSGWRLFYGNGGPMFQWAASPNGTWHNLPPYGQGTYPSNQWSHLAVVYSPTNISIYLNGTLLYFDNSPGSNLWLTAGYNLGIGSDFNGNHYYFPGLIDDVQVYSRALGTNEITTLYNADSDSDGIPNWWELAYGLNPNDAVDGSQPSQNPWAHGLTNRQVYENPSVLVADNYSTLNDGIADWWKVKYGFSLTDSSVANGDSDGDGYTNLQEHNSGTDPKNPANRPPIPGYGATPFTNSYSVYGTNFLNLFPYSYQGIYYQGDIVGISNSIGTKVEVYGFTANPKDNYDPPASITNLPVGHYWVQCVGANGGVGDRNQFVVLPSNYAGWTYLGDGPAVGQYGPQYETLARQARAKINWVRGQVTWVTVEPTHGTFDWSSQTIWVDAYTNVGVRLMNLDTIAMTSYETNNTQAAWITDFSLLCSNAAREFGSNVVYELFNEPTYDGRINTNGVDAWDVALGKAIEAGTRAIKFVCPNCKVWAPSMLSLNGYGFVVTNAELQAYYTNVDAITWHEGSIDFGPVDQAIWHPENSHWYNYTQDESYVRVRNMFQVYTNKTWAITETYPYAPDALGRTNSWHDNPYYADGSVWNATPTDWWIQVERFWKQMILVQAAGATYIQSYNAMTCCSTPDRSHFTSDNSYSSTDYYGWLEDGSRAAGPNPAISGLMMIGYWLNGAHNVTNWVDSNAHYSEWVFSGGTTSTFAWASELTSATNASGAYTTDIFSQQVTRATLTAQPVILWNWPP